MKAPALAVETWQEANQRCLVAALARVRLALEQHLELRGMDHAETAGSDLPEPPSPPALDRLCAAFGLSPFERDVLLLCAGVELDSSFAALCRTAQAQTGPTFSLALSALPGAHWSALTPPAPLRRWRLVEVGGGAAVTLSPLRIDERILHYLAGIDYMDERLAGIVESVTELSEPLCDSQRRQVDHLVVLWRRFGDFADVPPVQLIGSDLPGQQAVARRACAELDIGLCRMRLQALPTNHHELEVLLRLWQREAVLTGSALLLECHDLDQADSQRSASVARVLDGVYGPLMVAAKEHLPGTARATVSIDIDLPSESEQASLWSHYLNGMARRADVDALVSQFSLSAPAIRMAAQEVLGNTQLAETGPGDAVWDLCRTRSRPRLEALARRIEPRSSWDDLVLPEAQLRLLREAALHVRQRGTVYERWGFRNRYSRGLGISLLAAGPSGTGKTMAAEVIANDLHLDLYHIDLSQVVSKYIGETEKNLRLLFDAAEGGGAILLFDEADALFGKRSEIKDSHDRYANIEVSYLLQRMEAYRGLAILTTNMKDALDPAFLRRIRFVVQFPFPDVSLRTEIWRRVFPTNAPTEGLEFDKLARLNLSGGSIRNVALNAAFLAAGAGEPVRMKHLASAARGEFVKLEKPLNDVELATWL